MQYSILCGLAMVYCGITETTTGRYLAPYVIRCQSTTSLIIHILCYHVNCLFAPYFRLFRLYPNHLFCLTQLPDPKPSSTILFLWKVSRHVSRSENLGGRVVLGGDNVPPLVEIGLTDLPKTGGGVRPPCLPPSNMPGIIH